MIGQKHYWIGSVAVLMVIAAAVDFVGRTYWSRTSSKNKNLERSAARVAADVPWRDLSPHETKFVTVRPELKLEVLDWGGRGEGLVFLPGLGNSAHVFDDFAPRFRNQFHVMAVAPRGFGASTHPPEDYAVASLAEDVKLVLDNLDLRRVNIAAHSYGGAILSVFAARYGDRVHRIVYLDGAYDYTALPVLNQRAPSPTRPPMTESDRASVAAVRAYDARNILFPEAETRAIYRFDTQGKLLGDVTPDSISDLVLQGASRPPYRHIRAQALAIFAIPGVVTDYFPYYSELDGPNQERAFRRFMARLPWIKEQQALFRAECKESEVVELHGAHHYVFISHADSVEDSMRRFLKNEQIDSNDHPRLPPNNTMQPAIGAHKFRWTKGEAAPLAADRVPLDALDDCSMEDLSIPRTLQPLVTDCDFEPVTTGDSSAHVFRLLQGGKSRLFFKYGPTNCGLKEEADRLKWLSGRVRVPSLIAFVAEQDREFLLTEALMGRDGTEAGRERPEAVIVGLAQELHRWHSQPVAGCPFDQGLAVQIELARTRAQNGLVDEDDFDEERRGRSAMELLEQLDRGRPETEDRVLTHGDPCLPNVIFDGTECLGFVDCGRAGVADRCQDVALAARSIGRNLGREWVRPFFERYGLSKIDEGRLAFYRLLDEFF